MKGEMGGLNDVGIKEKKEIEKVKNVKNEGNQQGIVDGEEGVIVG